MLHLFATFLSKLSRKVFLFYWKNYQLIDETLTNNKEHISFPIKERIVVNNIFVSIIIDSKELFYHRLYLYNEIFALHVAWNFMLGSVTLKLILILKIDNCIVAFIFVRIRNVTWKSKYRHIKRKCDMRLQYNLNIHFYLI